MTSLLNAMLALLGGSLVTNAATIYLLQSKRKKISAEAALTTATAAEKIVQLYGVAIEKLEQEIACLKTELHELRLQVRERDSQIDLLRRQQ
jgi:hypothetical protein